MRGSRCCVGCRVRSFFDRAITAVGRLLRRLVPAAATVLPCGGVLGGEEEEEEERPRYNRVGPLVNRWVPSCHTLDSGSSDMSIDDAKRELAVADERARLYDGNGSGVGTRFAC